MKNLEDWLKEQTEPLDVLYNFWQAVVQHNNVNSKVSRAVLDAAIESVGIYLQMYIDDEMEQEN